MAGTDPLALGGLQSLYKDFEGPGRVSRAMRFTSWLASMLSLTAELLQSKAERASSNAGSEFRARRSTMNACCEEAICRQVYLYTSSNLSYGEQTFPCRQLSVPHCQKKFCTQRKLKLLAQEAYKGLSNSYLDYACRGLCAQGIWSPLYIYAKDRRSFKVLPHQVKTL